MIDLKSYFHDRYKGGEDFVENVILPIFGEDKYEDAYGLDVLEVYPEYVKMATSSGISQILQMGTIHIPMNPTNVFDITVFSRVQMERNRVAIQQLVRNIMGTYSSAFMVFHYDDDTRWDWRFTFCSKFGSNQDTTDSKRYTFLLGPNQSCRTAADNFKKLADKQGDIELQDIVKAFDVESLSKEFFEKYKVRYGRFVAHVIGKEYVDKGEGKGEWKEKEGLHPSELFYGLDEDEKVVRDYVKKLLGRIVFLHFLQKKGWLGATDEEWTNGSHDFMFQLFDKASEEQKDNFLDEILEPLFSCLDTPLTERREVFDTKVDGLRSIRVPFLGGLFERTDEDKAISIFPRELFADLFEFLSQYNFTIDENDPNDAQVGVDPEMLGRIFENLLEDNKDKGAFYTPKEIVQYMCRESLIAYLQTGVADEPTRKALAEFVRTHDVAALGGRDADLAQNVSQCLRNVKICDPAIGSGAFPMGLLNELFLCRGAIEDFSYAADIKRHIIQQNIYGVDIEKGAVEIARLRFWLSLIIDAEKPDVLPNMDFKIMQGNSLLEQYRGFDLSHIMEVKTEVHDGLQLQMFEDEVDVIRADVKRTISDYFTEKDHDKRRAMRRDIQQKIQQQINAQHFSVDISDIKDIAATDQFFLWHTWFSDVFEENGGFDIVIGNPPYVEARSSSVDEKQKDAVQNQLRLRHTNDDADCFPRGADLLIFFFELSFNIASSSGINTFITENSWLSTDYGSKFQKYILKNINTLGIVDSDYKYFDSADINTVITFFENKGLRTVQEVPFVHCHGDLSIHPYNIQENSSKDDTITMNSFNVADEILSNHKWGFLFSIDNRLLELLKTITEKEDKEFRDKIDIGQGLNLTKNCILTQEKSNSSPYYISDNGPLYRWTESRYYVDNKNASATRKKPILILPRGLGTHFCCMNEIGGYSASYVEIYEKSTLSFDDKLRLWAFCNSSLCWILRELTGRCNLGGGMLKAEATDLKRIPLCFKFDNIGEIRNVYNMCRDEKVSTSIDEAVESLIHKRIDRLVYGYFGLPEDSFVTTLLLERFHWRTDKSKNKKKK